MYAVLRGWVRRRYVGGTYDDNYYVEVTMYDANTGAVSFEGHRRRAKNGAAERSRSCCYREHWYLNTAAP